MPEGQRVQMNLYAMHHDPKHWKDPENFDPTRFLSEDQNTIKYDEWLQPFGYGKYNSLEYTNYSTRCLRWDCKHLRKKQYTTLVSIFGFWGHLSKHLVSFF